MGKHGRRCACTGMCARARLLPLRQCPRAGTLGTERVLAVDPKTYPRVGLKSFPDTLPLRDHEIVLTFDDGPSPPMTNKVLDTLAAECVHATFFLVGKPASGRSALVKRIAAEGHTIGVHSYTHANLAHISPEAAVEEIDRGFAACRERAARGLDTGPLDTVLSLPLFRIDPGRARSAAVPRYRRVRGRFLGQRLEPDVAAAGVQAR